MAQEKKETSADHLVKGKGLVLVVDDEPIMRKIAVNVLELSGYSVMSASDGDEAVDLYKIHYEKSDLVLLDLLMPRKSGKETFLEMSDIKPGVKVLLVTGAKKDKRVEELLGLGIKGYIEKPYKFLHLSQAVFEAVHT